MAFQVKISKSLGIKDDYFIGFKLDSNDELVFKYPLSFDFDETDVDEKKKQIFAIIKSFELTKKSNEKDILNTKSNNRDTTPWHSLVWILKDYLTYKCYYNKDKEIKIGDRGKINWKRTMRQIPYHIHGMDIYPNLYREKKVQVDNIIVEIYKFCVRKAIDQVGCWMFNMQYDDYLQDYKIPVNKTMFINYIRNEISKTFNDTKKIRLKHMLNILTGLDDNQFETDELRYGVDSYEQVFEAMLRKMLSNGEILESYYPFGTWTLLTERNASFKSSNLRPDIVMEDALNKKIYVVDAKYYKFGDTLDVKDLPNSTSIEKQVTYAQYIKKHLSRIDPKYANYEVFSCFVMPYNKNMGLSYYDDKGSRISLNKDFEYVGFASAPWNKPKSSSLGTDDRIVCILMDLKYLIMNYDKMTPTYDTLKTMIEDCVKEANKVTVKL